MYKVINKIYNKLFAKDVYYLYSMTIYHFIIIFYTLLGLKFQSKVFYTLTLLGNHANIFEMHFGNLKDNILWNYAYAYLLVLIIFILDIIFLIILMFEFKWLAFNYKKILGIELMLIGISFFFPFFRDVMFFLSINSLQIYIVYRIIIKNIWFLKIPIIFSSYMFIIRLILYPVLKW